MSCDRNCGKHFMHVAQSKAVQDTFGSAPRLPRKDAQFGYAAVQRILSILPITFPRKAGKVGGTSAVPRIARRASARAPDARQL